MKSLFTFENYLNASVVIDGMLFLLGILLFLVIKRKKSAPMACKNGVIFMSVGCCVFILPALLDCFILGRSQMYLGIGEFDKLRYIIDNLLLIVLCFQIHIFTYMVMLILRPIKLVVIKFWLQLSMLIILTGILMASIFSFPKMSPFAIFTMLISIFITICIMHISYTYKVINAHIQTSERLPKYCTASRKLRIFYTWTLVYVMLYFGAIFIPFEYRIIPLMLILVFYVLVFIKYCGMANMFPYKYGKYISPLQRGNNILDYESVKNVIEDYDENAVENEDSNS